MCTTGDWPIILKAERCSYGQGQMAVRLVKGGPAKANLQRHAREDVMNRAIRNGVRSRALSFLETCLHRPLPFTINKKPNCGGLICPNERSYRNLVCHMMTVIIISYNSFAVIERCQAEILNDSAFRFLIIDNASPDGSAEKLRARFPRCEVISLDKNVGYGRAANIGFRQVKTPYALLLNPDLIAKTEDLERFLRVAERDDENTALWGLH